MLPLYIYDPTATDEMSRVRGVGRYVQILRECLGNEAIFTNKVTTIPFESTLINPFFDPLKKPLLSRRVTKKQIAVIHDLIPLKYPTHFPIGLKGRLNVFLNKLSLRNYDSIITDSEASKRDIVQILKINPEKIFVIYPTIADVFYDKIASAAPRNDIRLSTRSYFLYVGDATWNKNLVNLAKAIQIANVSCVFVGKVFSGVHHDAPLQNPWLKELHEFLTIAKNDKRFIFPGYVSDVDLVGLYKGAIANILVSRDEGFGFSYFEAASQSTPSLLSDIPIFHETAGATALFANPHDPQIIAKVILQFIHDKKQRNKLGKDSYERTPQFSKEKFKEQVIQLLKEGKE